MESGLQMACIYHSFKKYLLSAFRCRGTVLSPSCTAVGRATKVYILGRVCSEQIVVIDDKSNGDLYYEEVITE